QGIARLDVPDAVFGRDFAGDDDVGGLAEGAGDKRLAVSIAVGERGVEEVDAGIARGGERAQGFVVSGADPHGFADAPGTVADVADLDSGFSEVAVLHECLAVPAMIARWAAPRTGHRTNHTEPPRWVMVVEQGRAPLPLPPCS